MRMLTNAIYYCWIAYVLCIAYLSLLPHIVPICSTADRPSNPENPGFCMMSNMMMIAVGVKLGEVGEMLHGYAR